MEEKLSNSNKRLKKLKDTLFDNDEEIKDLKGQINVYKRKVHEMQNSDEEKELKIGQQNKIIDEIKSDFKRVQEENNKIKYYFEMSLIKLKNSNAREKNLEIRNSGIELENMRLSVRAAGGFEELTPRPSFTGVEQLLNDVPNNTKDRVKKIITLALAKGKVKKPVLVKKGTLNNHPTNT